MPSVFLRPCWDTLYLSVVGGATLESGYFIKNAGGGGGGGFRNVPTWFAPKLSERPDFGSEAWPRFGSLRTLPKPNRDSKPNRVRAECLLRRVQARVRAQLLALMTMRPAPLLEAVPSFFINWLIPAAS